jgi:hypothetical protein
MTEVEGKGMKRMSMRLIVAILTFVIGVAAASAWFIYRKTTPPVTVCDLIQHPNAYASKNIRVRAILFGYHEMGLYAPDCEGRKSYIHAAFDRESWEKFKTTAKSTGNYHHFMDMVEAEFLLNATVEGRFEKMEGVDCDEQGRHTGGSPFSYDIYCYNFIISDVEQTEAANIDWPR